MSELRTALERVGARVTPGADAFERLGRAREAKRRRRRIGSGLVALIVAGAGIALAVSALGGSARVPASGHQTFREPEFGWTISYPNGWHLARFHKGGFRVSALGIRIGNFAVPGGNAGNESGSSSSSIPDLSFLRSFPRDGVLVQLWQLFGGPVAAPNTPDSRFPVTTRDLHSRPPYVGGSEPRPLYRSFVANGQSYALAVWIGTQASEQDRQAAQAIVGSWRFLPLREGTVIGQGIDFYVLGRPDHYPIASVLLLDPNKFLSHLDGEAAPFYLVHNQEGFYAVAGTHQDCSAVTYDARARQFVCPGGPRWTLEGALLSDPDPSRIPYDHLDIPMVRISVDGHVLVGSGAFVSDAAADLKLTGAGPEPSPSHPGGAFQWCPDTANSLPPGPDAAAEASSVALQFAKAYAAGDEATVRSLADDGAFDHASWSVSGSPDAISVQNAVTAQQDDLVTTGCGPEVAARTYAVTLDDGTDSASLDFTLYLIQRPEGWKVWGSY